MKCQHTVKICVSIRRKRKGKEKEKKEKKIVIVYYTRVSKVGLSRVGRLRNWIFFCNNSQQVRTN
jgi:sporulation protein YlmC with PRC-barrel domain